MKQVNAIIQSSDEPHILAGGLNSLDESDYSQERWTDIVKVCVSTSEGPQLLLPFGLILKNNKNQNQIF